MSGQQTEFEDRSNLETDARWALVQRVLASPHFLRAPQLRDILVYLSRRVLDDNPGTISESEVGCNALGRRADFNPNEDNIVRVQMRHLRKKLEEYFSAEGVDEPLVLTIPKGTYVPHFGARSLLASQRTPETEADSATPGQPLQEKRAWAGAVTAGATWRRLTIALGSLALVGLAVFSISLWKEKGELQRAAPPVERRPSPVEDILWPKIFAAGQQTTIVVADTCLVMVQDILDVDIKLHDYASGGYLQKMLGSISDAKLKAALELISTRQYTSLGDVNVATRVIKLSPRYNAKPRIRYARYLDTREFKTGNFVLIGSRRGIPWIQLFEPQMNFYLTDDPRTHRYYFHNRAPHAGEAGDYGISPDGKPAEESYADIAVLPNLEGSGTVLIISGITMEATEAAGEFVTSADFSKTMAPVVKQKTGEMSSSWEILLKVTTMPGTARASKVICYRPLP